VEAASGSIIGQLGDGRKGEARIEQPSTRKGGSHILKNQNRRAGPKSPRGEFC
jgi:hypothetical protein